MAAPLTQGKTSNTELKLRRVKNLLLLFLDVRIQGFLQKSFLMLALEICLLCETLAK
jgi:hypothetical protein